jgi:hypothetical protein
MTIQQMQKIYNVTLSNKIENQLNEKLINTEVIEVEYNNQVNYSNEEILAFEIVCSTTTGLRNDDCFICFGSEFFED